jgi:hypothetical protein
MVKEQKAINLEICPKLNGQYKDIYVVTIN